MVRRHLGLLVLLAAMLNVVGIGCVRAADAPLQRYEFVAPHMGTLFKIVLYAAEAAPAQAAADRAFARIGALDRAMSDYDPDSELSRLCRQPPGRPTPVSVDLLAVLQRSQRIAALSEGAFDITLGPSVRLWRQSRRTLRLPSPQARAAAARAVGADKLRLDAVARTAILAVAGMQLDLGGIGKGYAADQGLAVLRDAGFARAMVAASGDLALGAPPPGAAGWRVEIAPFADDARVPEILTVAHAGVSTSAGSEQFVQIGGRRYSHIVDPKTGLGLTRAAGVTVIAEDATSSDALATAASVLERDRVRRLVARLDAPVRMIVQQRDAAGVVRSEVFGTAPPGLVTVVPVGSTYQNKKRTG